MADARRCPFCNAEVGDAPHTGCPGLFREVMRPPGDVPDEVARAEAEGAARVRQYTLVRLLGRGGMGEVWKAWDRVLARWVALKFLLRSDERDAARFQREARMAARLRHPNIAAVYEVSEEGGRSFIAMDFVEGETLATADLPIEKAVAVFSAVARAVEAAHCAGVIHRDLKPQNILLSRELWPFVTDFGLAKSIAPEGTLSAPGSVLGTPAYMSPEQASGRVDEIDERSDVYSLGATFYHVLCREAPFSGEPFAILGAVVHRDPRPLRALRNEIPAALETIVLKAMSKSKKERYGSAAELADDLDRFLARENIRGRIPGKMHRLLRRIRGPAAGVMVLLAGVIGAVYLDRQRPPAASPASPEIGASQARRLWKEQLEERRFRSALRVLDQEGLVLPDPERAAKRVETERAARRFADAGVEHFASSLARIVSEAEFARLDAVRFESWFELPPSDETVGDLPVLDWARSCRALLEKIRAGTADGFDLASIALAAARLDPPLFAAAEEAAFRILHHRLSAETGKLADAPKAERDAARARVDAMKNRWREFVSAVPADVRALHALVDEHDRRIDVAADAFPVDLSFEGVDLLACLRAPNPEAELARAERELRRLEATPRLSIESRRHLYTSLVVAGAHLALLEGKSEDEAADRMKEYGPRLTAVGGAGDTSGFSPRIRRVAAILLRKWGQP